MTPSEVQMWQSVAGPYKMILHLFMHLADAFIQSELHSIQASYISVHAFPENQTLEFGIASIVLFELHDHYLTHVAILILVSQSKTDWIFIRPRAIGHC